MPFLTRFLLFVAIALTIGLGSAWRLVNHGFFATTQRYGPWALWFKEGVTDADPYTLAHTARMGIVPITAASQLTFTATRDSAGSRISGDCTYEIKGYAFSALWWNLAAFKPDGEIIDSKTGRSSFASTNILAAPDGRFTVKLSPDVQPGNWLPAERGRRIYLRLSILRPLNAGYLLQSANELLPEIQLLECT